MIQIDCPHCGHPLQIPDQYAGELGGCNYCKNKFQVPTSPLPSEVPVRSKKTPLVVVGAVISLILIAGIFAIQLDVSNVTNISEPPPRPGDPEFLDYGLHVYDPVPGMAPSDKYALRVRLADKSRGWHDAFAFITRCKQGDGMKTNNYFEHLSGWTNTYINFEMNRPVEVEIAKANGDPITKANAHPKHKVDSCTIRDGKVYVVLNKPALIAVDIDGQMDDQDTGKGYKGPPIHTVTVFGNPVIENRPSADDPSVYAVAAGDQPPNEGDWETLMFSPGVHDIGLHYPLHSNKSYYIPGDAIVHGTFNNLRSRNNGENIHVFGYGTISGERIKHPRHAVPPSNPANRALRPMDQEYNPVRIIDAVDVLVEGITIADSAHHSLQIINLPKPKSPASYLRWAKAFTWRGNGDGLGTRTNGVMEDCFMRTQDDCTYVAESNGIRRTTFWNDYNGSSFVLSFLANRETIVEDCDIIYSRAGWHHWAGGRVFNMRGHGGGRELGKGVIFRNIRVTDPRPTLQPFFLAMQVPKPWGNPERFKRGPGDLVGVTFQNIEITAPNVLGQPDLLWGMPGAEIRDITFDNVTIGGKKITSLDHFKHNEYVRNIYFK